MSRSAYYIEALSVALEEYTPHFKLFTTQQIQDVAEEMMAAARMEGEACGDLCIPDPQKERAERAERALRIERSKVVCPACGGCGTTTTSGPYHSSTSQCYKCRGEGKIL